METNLPLGQINPAARPVTDFIRPALLQPAGVAAPPGMPQLQGINQLQGPSQTSIGGANRFQDLAEALAPFNRALTTTLQGGAEGLASWAAQRGEQQANKLYAKNQALMAMSAADRTNEAGAFDYAAANRKLFKRDPEGGFLMDLLNPYREAGVRRGMSKLAGEEAQWGMQAAYDKIDPAVFTGDDKGFGALVKMRSEYTTQLAQRYGLETSTPGFINYALPKINSAWEKVQSKATQDRVEYLNATFPPLAAAQVLSEFSAVQQQFKPGATTIVVNGQQFPASNPEAIYEALSQRASSIIDSYAGAMGKGGESTKLAETVAQVLMARGDYKDNPTLRNWVDGIRVGPVIVDSTTGEKNRFTVGQLYSQQSIDSELKYGAAAFQRRQREGEKVQEGFSNQLANDLIQLAPIDQAGREAVVKQRIAEFQAANPGAPLAPILKAAKELVGVVGDLPGYGYAPDAGFDVIQDLREQYGAAWDPIVARQRANAALPGIAPDKRAEFLNSVESIIKEKEGKGGTVFKSTVTRIVEADKDARMKQQYGGDWKELILRGADNATDGMRGANLAEATRRYNAAIYPYVNRQLELKAAELKRPLTEAETGEVAARAAREYGTKTEEGKAALKNLFPGGAVSGAPAVKGTNATPPPPGGVDGKPRPPAPVTFNSSQLDNMPKRLQRLLNWRDEPILSREAISEEMQRAMSGQPFSPALKRAAMDGRAPSPGEFLAGQAKHWKIQMDPAVLQELNKRAEAVTTPQRYLISLASTAQPTIARAGRWALDAVTGVQPASAATYAPMRLEGGGGLPPAARPSGAPRPSGGDAANAWGGIVSAARAAGAKFPELVAAQWALESDWGRSQSGRNNLFGQKGKGTTRATQEEVRGRMVTTSASFMDFPSRQAAIQHLVDNWYRGRNGANQAGTVEEAARWLKAQGYATDSRYATKLLQILRRAPR